MRVFLIHGMGRSRASMALVAARLRRAGHPVSSFGYAVRRDSVAEIATQWATHIEKRLQQNRSDSGSPVKAPEPYAIIGHSLGNIVTREASAQLPAGLCRFIMLAPPNSSPVMARFFQGNPLFKVLTKDGGQKLADPNYYKNLARPDVPTLIIAGDRGPRLRWLPLAGEHDGLVGLEEAKLDDLPLHVVPAMHTFIMNHPQVMRAIHHFLERGTPPEASVGEAEAAA